jgi:integrase
LVSGVETNFEVGHYELGSYVGSKRVWTRVKGNASATDALAALRTAQGKANAVVVAEDAGLEVVVDTKRVALKDAAKKFVQAAVDRKATESAEVYERTLTEFLAGCKKTYVEELTNADVLRFHGEMRKRGLSERTVHNRHMGLRAFLIKQDVDVNTVAGKAPKFEKTLPEIYDPADLKKFFKYLDSDYDRLLFDLLLTTGLREREAMHLEWIDISDSRRVLQVRSKPRYKHKIKDSEERELPLTEELVTQLKAYRKVKPGVRLVFGKLGGAEDVPDGHLLRRLKKIVKNAGLNCGNCETCVSNNECQHWFLHKFRATYITTLLRSGMDLRTVMHLSGHADMESVMRYLRPAQGQAVQDRVNAIKWRQVGIHIDMQDACNE